MLAASVPVKFPIPFANSAGGGYIRQVPTASQIGIQAGAASLTDGFPPICFLPVGSGGVPPFGQDFNGLMNQSTAWSRWQSAGGPIYYDAVFSEAVGGYPYGALLASSSNPLALWISTADNNTSDPDTGGANWDLCVITQAALDARYQRLAIATTFYVNGSTGNDGNTGTSATVGAGNVGPFATLQGAVDAIAGNYLASGAITINVANGAYVQFSVTPSFIANWNWVGNTGSPGSVTVTAASGNAFSATNSTVGLTGFSFASTQANISAVGSTVHVNNCNLSGSSTTASIAAFAGSTVVMSGNIGFSGNGVAIAQSQSFSTISLGLTTTVLTLTGTPTFSVATFVCFQANISFTAGNLTLTGSASGARYSVNANGIINTSGQGATYLPGSSSGVAANGGLYI